MYCLIFEAVKQEVQFVEVQWLRSLTEELKNIPALKWEGRDVYGMTGLKMIQICTLYLLQCLIFVPVR